MSGMISFLIYRIGSNAANQSCRDRMAVAIVDAPTEALALEHAALNIEHFAGQHFEAVPEKEADSDDWNAVVEDDEIQELNVGYRRYKIEGWSETLDIRGDFAEASDCIAYRIGGGEWVYTPYQVADFRHRHSEALEKIVAEYLSECDGVPEDEIEIPDWENIF